MGADKERARRVLNTPPDPGPTGGTPVDTTKDSATRVPDHARIRLDAAAHPERSYREHIEAAREIAGETYVEDLRRIQRRGRIEEEEM
jgi:hypothetical protein